jgi:hypothetical protein
MIRCTRALLVVCPHLSLSNRSASLKPLASSTVTVTAPQVSNPTPGTRLFPVEHNARRKPLSSAPGSRTTQGSHEDTPPVVHTSHSRQIYILCKYCSRKFYAKQNAKKSLSAAGRNLKSHEDEWHLNPGWGDATWKTRVPVKELAEKCLIPLPLSPQATPADFFEEILTKATHEEEWDTLPDVVQGVLARLFQENETLRKLADTRSLSYQKAMDYDFDKYKLDGDNKTQTPYQKYWSVVVHCLHYFMYPPTTSPSRFDSPEPGSVLNQTRSTSRGDVLSWLNLPKTGGMAFDLAIPSGSTSAGQQSRHHTTPTCDDHPSNASPSLNSDQPMADAP